MQNQGPVREHIVPTETMARWLIENGTDLGSEAQVIIDLRRWGFSAEDIDAGMDGAIDVARAIKQDTDTPLKIARDLAACAAIFAGVFVWALPARAAGFSSPAEAIAYETAASFYEAVVLLVVIAAIAIAAAYGLNWLLRPKRRAEPMSEHDDGWEGRS
jgi:hypothetical protein